MPSAILFDKRVGSSLMLSGKESSISHPPAKACPLINTTIEFIPIASRQEE